MGRKSFTSAKGNANDFAALLDAHSDNLRSGFNPGETVTATLLGTQGEFLPCSVGAKQEALIAAEELTEDGQIKYQVGDTFQARFAGMKDGTFLFTTRTDSRAPVTDAGLHDAFAQALPVEGTVQKEINGGYEVTVNGQRAFCPFSQIALYKQEGAEYAGKKFNFLITEYGHDERGTNLVLSRRALLEREREEQTAALLDQLQEGQIRSGTVTRIVDFGCFVDLGGTEGLVPLRELSWQRGTKPSDVVKEGDRVDVCILSVDRETKRISLSLRAVQGDPWDQVVEKYPVGSVLEVTITRVEPFGAFAQIVPGIDGFLSTGRLAAGRRVRSAHEVATEGQRLEAQIEEIDYSKRRIALKPLDRRVAALKPGELAIGTETNGIVEGYKPFGVFVRLSEEKTGLLHVSETDIPRQGSAVAHLERQFPAGSEIKVVVKSLEGNRISLTLPSKWAQQQEEAQDDWRAHLQPSGSLGSLGDAFKGLDL